MSLNTSLGSLGEFEFGKGCQQARRRPALTMCRLPDHGSGCWHSLMSAAAKPTSPPRWSSRWRRAAGRRSGRSGRATAPDPARPAPGSGVDRAGASPECRCGPIGAAAGAQPNSLKVKRGADQPAGDTWSDDRRCADGPTLHAADDVRSDHLQSTADFGEGVEAQNCWVGVGQPRTLGIAKPTNGVGRDVPIRWPGQYDGGVR